MRTWTIVACCGDNLFRFWSFDGELPPPTIQDEQRLFRCSAIDDQTSVAVFVVEARSAHVDHNGIVQPVTQ